MKNLSKKNIIILIISIIIFIAIIITSIFGVKAYKEKKEQEFIESCITVINEEFNQFEIIDDRTEKFNMLKTEIDKCENHKNSEDCKEEIVNAYNEKINSMKQYFISDYELKLSENTIQNIKDNSNKKQINTSKKSLTDLLKVIESESQFTLTKEEYSDYQTKINDLIKSYDSRIKEIEEAEKKAKEEAERKTAEEAKKYSSNNSKNNYSNKNSGSNYSSSNNSNTNGLIRKKWYDENGNLVADNYSDGYGHLYDLNGNRLENDEGWW